jgi:DNA polymerase-1
VHKLLTTYSKFNVDTNNRLHPNYKIHGTATGRLSSSEPNAQNFPHEVCDIFVAPPGKVIIKADYSNIEVRVLAYMTGEQTLIDALESGKNIHDLNTQLLFNLKKGDKGFDEARRACKIFVFGIMYGGTVEGIYKRVIAEVPKLQITLSSFKKAADKFFNNLTSFKAWCKRVQDEAMASRTSVTAFGRKRIMLGTEDEIKRQALNTPIQGTAGEIAEMAIIESHWQLQMHSSWDAKLICTVHDSILVEANEATALETASLLKDIMEKEVVINGRCCKFPVDIEIGPSWGKTKKIEESELAGSARNNRRINGKVAGKPAARKATGGGKAGRT